jgi:hypothetical protein
MSRKHVLLMIAVLACLSIGLLIFPQNTTGIKISVAI